MWEGFVRPTPMSEAYRIRIRYSDHSMPKIFVLAPDLDARRPERVPHRYADGSLCLHRPEQWSPGDSIASTIVPWISLWLYYFEIWVITGKWLGGGDHPEPEPTTDSHDRALPNPIH